MDIHIIRFTIGNPSTGSGLSVRVSFCWGSLTERLRLSLRGADLSAVAEGEGGSSSSADLLFSCSKEVTSHLSAVVLTKVEDTVPMVYLLRLKLVPHYKTYHPQSIVIFI